MSRARLPQLHNIKDGSFEPNKKNAISLGDDSVLSTDSKPIKIGDKSSILELSEDSLIIRGAIEFDTLLRGILNSPNERMAFTAKTGEYRWYSTDNDEDYVRMFVLGGNCLLQAVDASGGTEADINLDAGNDIILDATADIELNADGGNITFKDDTTTMLDVETTVIKSEIPLKIKESADAVADTAGYGQIWVDTQTPNCLAFTDDAGTDIIGIGKYHYETKFIGFYAGQTSQYIQMTGYIIEKTSTASNNEFISFVAPYNCTIEKFIYRSEVAQDGNITVAVWESSDGTETPGLRIFSKANAVDIADDTFVDLDLTSPLVGSDYAPLTKGKIYAISLTTPSSGYDTNITVVFKWDITS